jgi:FOG: FHA domain
MSKISVKKFGNRIVVTNKLVQPEAINERELNALSAGLMSSFMPVVSEKKKKDSFLVCTVVSLVPLSTYFAGIVSKKMFLNVVLQIVGLVKTCENNLMNANNLCLSMKYIFIDSNSKEISSIFWPVVNNQAAQNPAVFLKDLPYSVIFNKNEDNSYVKEYIAFFETNNPFSINGFERFIYELSGKQIVNTGGPSGPTNETNGHKKVVSTIGSFAEAGNIAYNPFSNISDSDPLGDKTRTKRKEQNAETSKKANYYADDSGNSANALRPRNGTTLLGLSGDRSTYPYLVREKTGERVVIDKERFLIGKDDSQADGIILGNTAISGVHVEIITHLKHYYIVDKNSTNKTYINNQLIIPNQTFEIIANTKIRLANEEFVFYL